MIFTQPRLTGLPCVSLERFHILLQVWYEHSPQLWYLISCVFFWWRDHGLCPVILDFDIIHFRVLLECVQSEQRELLELGVNLACLVVHHKRTITVDLHPVDGICVAVYIDCRFMSNSSDIRYRPMYTLWMSIAPSMP